MSVKIAIIGGGASGMMAAISARRKGGTVTIFERNSRVGKKLLSTGNGRCNITNVDAISKDENGDLCHYYGEDKAFAFYALRHFDNNALLDFFGELGVLFRCEDGKYYPYSETASTVLDILRLYCEKLGIRVVSEADIKEICEDKQGFEILGEHFDKAIVACGGMSSPHLGTDGSGYKLLSKFNHKRTKLSPAITQIKTENKLIKQLKGIKCNSTVTAFGEKNALRKEYGQVLFCDYGLSGPPIFQLSSCFDENESGKRVEIDFTPEFSFNEVYENLNKIKSNPFMNDFTAQSFLMPMFPRKVGEIIIKYCDIPLNAPVDKFKNSDLKKIANAIKHFSLAVLGTKGFTNAQVTAGGIMTADFDCRTMQSKLKKGLYACGEVLDVTGDCGGYNLQWAFSSGYLAGVSAVND